MTREVPSTEGSLIDKIAKIPPNEYEAFISKLPPERLNTYISYLIGYGLSGVGAGIQLVQSAQEAKAEAENTPKPKELILSHEAAERLIDHFKVRFTNLLPHKKFQVNDILKVYLWDKGKILGSEARKIAGKNNAKTVDLASVDEALAGISAQAIKLTERFNSIVSPVEPLDPICDAF